MTQDKALRNALNNRQTPPLSLKFSARTMEHIHTIEAKRKRRASIVTAGLIFLASAGLIALAISLLKNYLPSPITFPTGWLHPDAETISKYGFGFYIAILCMILMGFDYLLRHHWQKKREKKA